MVRHREWFWKKHSLCFSGRSREGGVLSGYMQFFRKIDVFILLSSAPQVLLSVQDERKEQINCFDFLHITIDSRKNAMSIKWIWIAMMLLCAYPCAAENDRKGMTWE